MTIKVNMSSLSWLIVFEDTAAPKMMKKEQGGGPTLPCTVGAHLKYCAQLQTLYFNGDRREQPRWP